MSKHAEAIRRLLVQGRTQKEVAQMLGVSQSTVSVVARGHKRPYRARPDRVRPRGAKPLDGKGDTQFTYAWTPREVVVPPPNALPWATKARLMAGR